tara:strand:+ start:2727 stop:2993 length:267 start_codon:yes stop_codon:yes gene_type:complete
MVEDLAYSIGEKERKSIQQVFEDNANYFSKHEKHHTKKIQKMFKFYNKYFGEATVMWRDEDVNCNECQTTIIKLWSTIIYDLWEREII